MTGQERREQLIEVGRGLFAEKGFDGTSVEEVAARAQVSKPVVYEHFGGKEGLYAVIVDREVRALLDAVRAALASGERPRELLELATLALLRYVETDTDGFRILIRDSQRSGASGSYAGMLNDIGSRVEDILMSQFRRRRLDPESAPVYAQMLVGMVSLTGQWWLDHPQWRKEELAAHLVNLAWNGMLQMDAHPTLATEAEGRRRPKRAE